MSNEETRNLETIPVGKLGIIPLASCKELGEKVNNYLVEWRNERENEHHANIVFEGYQRDNYIISARVPRFGSGEAKGVLGESVRGYDLYLCLLYTSLRQVLERENFSHFREDYYPEDMIDPGTGLSSRRLAQTALAEAHRFIEDFSQTHPNLFLYGSTGTGKTFLTNCIAKELLERSFSVLYFSSGQLFDRFSRHSFSSEKEDDDFRYHVFDCDLLIIDDLGTEMVNAFVSSQLVLLINERLMRRKSTVISTNLTPENFLNPYSERIFSRISSSYQILKLFGDDIRLRLF